MRPRSKLWRRSYDVPPPPLPPGDPGCRGPTPATGTSPRPTCRPPSAWPTSSGGSSPTGQDSIVPDLVAEGERGGAVLVAAHGNSIRALRKHIEGIADADIVDLEVPTGIPFRMRLDGT